jgi:hypothetical protein
MIGVPSGAGEGGASDTASSLILLHAPIINVKAIIIKIDCFMVILLIYPIRAEVILGSELAYSHLTREAASMPNSRPVLNPCCLTGTNTTPWFV